MSEETKKVGQNVEQGKAAELSEKDLEQVAGGAGQALAAQAGTAQPASLGPKDKHIDILLKS